jgi:hypothetical protein
MTTESQREQSERRRVLAQDQSVRDQRFDLATLQNLREIENRPGAVERVKARIAEKVREQGSTLADHHHPEMGGRWSAVGAQTVTGATAAQQWPKSQPRHLGPDPT